MTRLEPSLSPIASPTASTTVSPTASYTASPTPPLTASPTPPPTTPPPSESVVVLLGRGEAVICAPNKSVTKEKCYDAALEVCLPAMKLATYYNVGSWNFTILHHVVASFGTINILLTRILLSEIVRILLVEVLFLLNNQDQVSIYID
jgi:hypothetical protein